MHYVCASYVGVGTCVCSLSVQGAALANVHKGHKLLVPTSALRTQSCTCQVCVVGGVDEIVVERLAHVMSLIEVAQIQNVVLLAHQILHQSFGAQPIYEDQEIKINIPYDGREISV